ncbi:MAG: HAMP domain-containing protein [Anaerolineae bacterium]|nr:HAMP domain-containing protein [Anaerolineae bacterium]
MMRRYLNQLWVRLSIAFALVVLIGAALVTVSGFVLTQRGFFIDVVREQITSENGLIKQLEDFYQTTGNWDGAGTLISNYQNTVLPLGTRDIALVFSDAEGNVLYNSDEVKINENLTVEAATKGIPVRIDGVTRGYIQVIQQFIPPPQPQDTPRDLQRLILERLSQTLLLLALVGGSVGIFTGVLMSRSVTAPLSHLAETAQAFGTMDMSKRAEVKGSEEVVAVAKAFNNMADALAQNEMLRRNMVADIAHELRTPLTVLQANLQAIADGVYPLSKDEIDRLMDQTHLLNRLVEDLHQLAQAEAHQLRMNMETVDLNSFIEEMGEQFRAMSESHNVMLKVEHPATSVNITADPNRLQQVLNNLLQNALTHTPSGGSITLGVNEVDGMARIRVQDTGSGIAAEHLPHVFERFYRVDRSRSRTSGGAGLGLAIVKAITEMHGGQVEAMSEGEAGKGSVFTIRLPVIAG